MKTYQQTKENVKGRMKIIERCLKMLKDGKNSTKKDSSGDIAEMKSEMLAMMRMMKTMMEGIDQLQKGLAK